MAIKRKKKRESLVMIRVTEEEKDRLSQKAISYGMSLSTWLRGIGMRTPPRKQPNDRTANSK